MHTPTTPPPPAAPAPATPATGRAALGWRWLGGLLAVLACLAVFGLYTAPGFMVQLADQLWACF